MPLFSPCGARRLGARDNPAHDQSDVLHSQVKDRLPLLSPRHRGEPQPLQLARLHLRNDARPPVRSVDPPTRVQGLQRRQSRPGVQPWEHRFEELALTVSARLEALERGDGGR